MRITIVSAVFPPEPVMTAMTSADLAQELTRQGHKVTVITAFPNRPSGRVMDGYNRKWKYIEYRDGYKIIHCWHTLSDKSTFLSRILENITFGFTTSWRIIKEKRPDAVYIVNWALVAQSMNSWLLSKLRVRIVTTVHDIYPESVIDKKMISPNGLIARIWKDVHKRHLDRCTYITTLSQRMVEYLVKTRNLSSEKVVFLPSWMDESQFSEHLPKNNAFRKQHNIDRDTFIAVFAGSLTLSAGLDVYLRAAELIDSVYDIQIILVGDGSQRQFLEKEIVDKKLTKVKVIYPLAPKEVHLVHSAADILLMSLSEDMVTSAAPSKQVSYMLSGRPVIANVCSDGDPAMIINETGCGYVIPPGDARALADLLIKLSLDRSNLEEMGYKAREYALNNFSKSKVLPRMVNLVAGI